MNDLLKNQSPALHPTSSAHRASTSDASTITGESLICMKPTPHSPAPLHPPSPTHTCSDCSSIGDLSVHTGTSLLSIPSTDIHLDLQSYGGCVQLACMMVDNLHQFNSLLSAAQSSCPPTSPSPPPTPTGSDEDDSSLLFRDQQKFYQNMMVSMGPQFARMGTC